MQAAAHDRNIYWKVTLPGGKVAVPVVRLIALTGTRVLNVFKLLNAQGDLCACNEPTPPVRVKRKLSDTTRRTDQPARKLARCEEDALLRFARLCTVSAAGPSQGKDYTRRTCLPESLVAQDSASAPPCGQVAVDVVATIMCGKSPTQMSCNGVVACLQTCDYFLAFEVIAAFPDYLLPALRKLTVPQVRCCPRYSS